MSADHVHDEAYLLHDDPPLLAAHLERDHHISAFPGTTHDDNILLHWGAHDDPRGIQWRPNPQWN